MTLPLMPKATAVWLIDNTTLTFEQISEFCGMHPLEVKSIADGDVAQGIIGWDPVLNGQLTIEEIKRCEQTPTARLQMSYSAQKHLESKKKAVSRYTPVVRRQDKPDAIAWLLKNCPEMTDLQISKLIGTTKSTIGAVKNKTHWNSANLRPRDPMLLGLCSQTELDRAIEFAKLNASSDKSKKSTQALSSEE